MKLEALKRCKANEKINYPSIYNCIIKMGGQLRLAGIEPHPGRIDPQLVPVISLSLLLNIKKGSTWSAGPVAILVTCHQLQINH